MELAKMLLGYFGHPRPIHFLASPARAEFANKSRQQLLNLCGKYYTIHTDEHGVYYIPIPIKSGRRSHKRRLLKRNSPFIWGQ